MNIKVTTTYKNVDEEWLQWWLENNPLAMDPAKGKLAFPHKFISRNPSSEIVAETVAELEDSSIE